MAELIIHPDAVVALCIYVRATLIARGLPSWVGTEVPYPREERFVRLQRVGGTRRNLVVDQPSIAVEAWAVDEDDAFVLAQLVRAAIHATVGMSLPPAGVVYRVDEFAGPASLPDPDSNQARVTFTVSVAVRGQAA